jgi:hypothetical protein
MNPDQEKQDELQRVLALKRHESPPPRFFKGFSHKVIDGLHSPERPADKTWWQRIGFDPDNKPVLVCASGVIVCGLLGFGLIVSLRVERPKVIPGTLDERSQFVVAPAVNTLAIPAPLTVTSPPPDETAGEAPPVGAPVVISGSSPFSPAKSQAARATINGSAGDAR